MKTRIYAAPAVKAFDELNRMSIEIYIASDTLATCVEHTILKMPDIYLRQIRYCGHPP